MQGSTVCTSNRMLHSMSCCPGDGALNCTPSSQLLLMKSDYTTDGVGTLSCDQGPDIVYPEGAPGFVYDPTGYLLTFPGRQVRVADACGTRHTFFHFVLFFCYFFFLFLQIHMVGCLNITCDAYAVFTCKGCMNERKHRHDAKYAFWTKRGDATLSSVCFMLMVCKQLVHQVLSIYGKGAMVYVVSIFRAPFQGKQRKRKYYTFWVNLLRSQVLYRAAQGYLFNLRHCHTRLYR